MLITGRTPTEEFDQVLTSIRMLPESEQEQQLRSLQSDATLDPMVLQSIARLLNMDVEPSQIHVPEHLGSYTLLEKIGEGGMGVVYKALQTKLEREVAVKVLHSNLHARAFGDAAEQFDKETRHLAKLEHPGIARIYDVHAHHDQDQDRTYYCMVMELIDGLPLTEYCDQRRVGFMQRLHIFQKVCDAVSNAHRHGIVHRDLKPANILLSEDLQPHVLDFGLAEVIDAFGRDRSHTVIAGTFQYMSPEQINARPIKNPVQSDVYSLGLILFELLTGQRPYQVRHGTIEEMRNTVTYARIPKLPACRVRHIKRLNRILRTALAKDPRHRYQTVSELWNDVYRLSEKLRGMNQRKLEHRMSELRRRMIPHQHPIRPVPQPAARQAMSKRDPPCISYNLAVVMAIVAYGISCLVGFTSYETSPWIIILGSILPAMLIYGVVAMFVWCANEILGFIFG
jgi:serine/threonine protein kinase